MLQGRAHMKKKPYMCKLSAIENHRSVSGEWPTFTQCRYWAALGSTGVESVTTSRKLHITSVHRLQSVHMCTAQRPALCNFPARPEDLCNFSCKTGRPVLANVLRSAASVTNMPHGSQTRVTHWYEQRPWRRLAQLALGFLQHARK